MKILPNVHLIRGYSNSYVVELDNQNILIDTGIWWEAGKIIKYVKKKLKEPSISKILLTHGHPDHIEGVPRIKKEFNTEVYINENDLPFLTGVKKYEPPKSPKWLWKFSYLFLKQPSIPNAKTTDALPSKIETVTPLITRV